MKQKNHYQNISRLISRALSKGAESTKMEQLIREECVNLYVEKQIIIALEKVKHE